MRSLLLLAPALILSGCAAAYSQTAGTPQPPKQTAPVTFAPGGVAPQELRGPTAGSVPLAENATGGGVAPGTAPLHATLMQRFAAADTDHDGELSLAEARANWPWVARHWKAIDRAHRGYVTLDEIRAYARRSSPYHPHGMQTY